MNHELSAGIGSFFFFFPTVAVSHTAGLAMLFIWHNMGMLSETHWHKSLKYLLEVVLCVSRFYNFCMHKIYVAVHIYIVNLFDFLCCFSIHTVRLGSE